MIYLNSRNLENAGSVGEELAELREVAGSPCQSQRGGFQDNQVLHETNTKKRH
jgi:hypothetical protein